MKYPPAKRLFGLLGLLFALVTGACGELALCDPAFSPTPARSISTHKTLIAQRMADDIDRYVSRLAMDGSFSGVVLVTYRGSMVLENGYGWADKAQGVKNKLTTKFRISSLTKSFTAMAILHLEEQGRLNTEDRVCSYLYPCPEAWRKLTIHHLLTHTSGLPDFVRTPGFLEAGLGQHRTSAELLALVADQPLVSEPGSQFAYSNTNYLVLGIIIGYLANPELPVELAYGNYLEEHIFGPLNMENTGIEQCEAGVVVLAAGYVEDGLPALSCDPANFFAMGDLYTTVSDLYLWGKALGNDALLSAPVREKMFVPRVATSQYQTYYGYGWFITKLGHIQYIWHEGATPGFRSFFRRDIDEETMVIILSNVEVAPVAAMGREISAILIRRGKDEALEQGGSQGGLALPEPSSFPDGRTRQAKLASI